MGRLSELPNIGKVLEKQLNDVGIMDDSDLIDLGSKESWLKIKEIDQTACLNKLMALEGAIQNIRNPECANCKIKDICNKKRVS